MSNVRRANVADNFLDDSWVTVIFPTPPDSDRQRHRALLPRITVRDFLTTSTMLRTSVACLLLAVYSVSAVTEYIALGKGSAGTSGGGGAPTPDLAWVKMTYETNAKLVGDVSVESAGNDENVPEFLRHLVLSSSFSLTAKYYEEKLYAYHNFGNVPTDQVVIVYKEDRGYRGYGGI